MSRSSFPGQNAISLLFLYLKRSATQRACAMLLLAFIAAWSRPAAIAQSATPLDAQIKQAVDAQLAIKGLAKTGSENSVREIVKTTNPASQFNIQAQNACETELFENIGAREVFSGKAHEVLTEIALAYGRPIPHIYIFPGSWNMAYIAASTAVDGRGKIVVGEQASELFDTVELRGLWDTRWHTWLATTLRSDATITSFAIHILKPMPMQQQRGCLECNPSRRFWRGHLYSLKTSTRTQKAGWNCCNDFNCPKFQTS